jgi:hypothetical protein
MQENFLHFLWQFQYFERQKLLTTAAEPLHILQSGVVNMHAGPDFSHARIKIGEVEWAGQVEIHIRSSDWDAHHHQQDSAYDAVILHVVWQHDKPVYRKDGTLLPTLELQYRTSQTLTRNYYNLLASKEPIPCARSFPSVKDIYKVQALDKALMQRLEQKADSVKNLLDSNNHDWEETTYQLLAKNFGFKLNSEPFLQVARAVPLKLLQKHNDNLLQIEAMLFGQAGFLETENTDEYVTNLKREYTFLSHKYQLSGYKLLKHVWKFSRLRPANFPTLRMAHLAALLQANKSLFSLFIHIDSFKEFSQLLSAKPSLYWQSHYTFEKHTAATSQMGKEGKENILVNTVIPLLVCYAEKKDDKRYLDKALQLLETLPGEDNFITRLWKDLTLPIKNAFDAQASIELYNNFCMPKKCLSCPVGLSLLKKSNQL